MTMPRGFTAPIFSGMDSHRMAVASDEIGALVDRVQIELPRLVERVRMIDQPAIAKTVAA